MTERRVFTDEFKREAVRLANERGNVVQTARELARLRQDSHLRSKWAEENEILKKAVGIFTSRPA